MKNLIVLVIALFALGFESQAQEITFEASKDQGGRPHEWNYGTIQQGSNGVRKFNFKNTGDAPLVISAAKGSCGCTVPSYTKEPIMPGASSVISVKYDTKRIGAFTKYVTLTTNAKTNTTSRLKITGVVQAKPAPPAVPAPAPAPAK